MSEISMEVLAVLEPISCLKCGVVFAVPDHWRKKRIEDRDWFWCPNGHQQRFIGETEAEKLKRQLEQVERQKKWTEERLESARRTSAHCERVVRGLRGALAKAKKRQVKP